MAIKTGVLGSIPAVDLDHLQYSEFHMVVGENSPHNISISGKLRSYGIDSGIKYYSKDAMLPLNIPNLDAYIVTKVANARKAEAVLALAKVQEGLGILASIYYDIDFVGVE